VKFVKQSDCTAVDERSKVVHRKNTNILIELQ